MQLPSKEQILSASKRCPQAKNALEELFPEAFECEWKDVTKKLTWELKHTPDGSGISHYWFKGTIKGKHLVSLGIDETKSYKYHKSKLEMHKRLGNFRVLMKQ